jgi:integrase
MRRAPYSIYRRGSNGVLYFQFWNQTIHRYESAKSTGTRNLTKAKAYIRSLIDERDAIAMRFEDPYFTDYLKGFWDWDKSIYIHSKLMRRPNSIGKAYVRASTAYIERYAVCFFRKARRSEILTRDLEAFLLHLRQTTSLSPRSINAVYDAVAIPIREAFRIGEIENDPSRAVRKLWMPQKEKGIPSTAEVAKLSALEWPDPRVACAFKVAAICGLRLGEIRALCRDAIGDETITVKYSYSVVDGLKSPKNGRVRVVPVPAFLHDELLSLAKKSPHHEDWIFWGNVSGKPLDGKVITTGFYTAMARIGIDEDARKKRNITFHSLRHFCNSILRGALPDEKLRQLTGHIDRSMTDRYDHITDIDMAIIKEAQEKRLLQYLYISA